MFLTNVNVLDVCYSPALPRISAEATLYQKLSRFPTHNAFYLVPTFDGLPTAASLFLGEILESSDCDGLNGAERRSLEAVLIHKNTGWVSPRLIPSSPQSLNFLSNMPYKLSFRHNRFESLFAHTRVMLTTL
jgi:hypothetical protein